MFLVTEMLLTTSHPYPKYDETDQEAKKLQIIEAKKHSKFNTVCFSFYFLSIFFNKYIIYLYLY